ncbi:zinc-binding dehydrogenase [Nesterenkonia sp. Act20]|uniref:zinc-dependent alcohol dehydrogenase n=1 Tax=Nesterenkonia sp. Act20 TaxID=1483432 RepID=UPI001C448A05|nr:alcohol dehydrogenase catalytic domain-containing protein [Nesterenkonia sp. Act20]
MRAAKYIGDGRITLDPEAEEFPPGSGEVQIEVAYSGICGTDLHVLHGDMDQRVQIPSALGHEMSGRVHRVGEGVVGISTGDAVTVMPLKWCGQCKTCRAGHQHICPQLQFIGIDSPGAMQSRWTVPAETVVPVPANVDLREAALIEPLAVAVHDVSRSRLVAGETALVIGGGPIGQLIALVALRAGANVVLSEPDQGRRHFASENGIRTVDPLSADLAAVLDEHTDGVGADVVFEVAGLSATALDAMQHARPRGRVVIVAIHPKPVPMDLHRMFWRELEVLGARVYERADFDKAVELLSAGQLPVHRLISDVVPLEKAQDAFVKLSGSQAMKVLVDVQSQGEQA